MIRDLLVFLIFCLSYFGVGLVVALVVALTWKAKDRPDMRLHILGWPLTIVLFVWSLLTDAFGSLSDSLASFAVRERKKTPQIKGFSKFRIR